MSEFNPIFDLTASFPIAFYLEDFSCTLKAKKRYNLLLNTIHRDSTTMSILFLYTLLALFLLIFIFVNIH